MDIPAMPDNESERLQVLKDLELLDTLADPLYDRVTQLASMHYNVPMAAVSLVDSNRQWFKSSVGLGVSETPRDVSFCGHAILNAEPLIVEDAHLDSRFIDNPLVIGEPYIRFYAAVPFTVCDNVRVGTLCVLDDKPREFSKTDIMFLSNLAKSIELELINIIKTTKAHK